MHSGTRSGGWGWGFHTTLTMRWRCPQLAPTQRGFWWTAPEGTVLVALLGMLDVIVSTPVCRVASSGWVDLRDARCELGAVPPVVKCLLFHPALFDRDYLRWMLL